MMVIDGPRAIRTVATQFLRTIVCGASTTVLVRRTPTRAIRMVATQFPGHPRPEIDPNDQVASDWIADRIARHVRGWRPVAGDRIQEMEP